MSRCGFEETLKEDIRVHSSIARQPKLPVTVANQELKHTSGFTARSV